MKKYFCLIMLCLFPFMGMCALYDTFTVKTVEGIDVTYMITEAGKLSVGARVGSNKKPTTNATDVAVEGVITIPSEVEYKGTNYIVSSIGANAFKNCTGLIGIKIPNSVTSIGDNAFRGCTSLTSIVNLSNLTFSKGSSSYGYIAHYANKVFNAPDGFIDGDLVWFENEDGMVLVGYLGDATELILPTEYNGKSVTIIGESAFRDCSGLTSITIPNSVTSIGDDAFNNCSGLTSIAIPNSVTSIGKSAFYNCSSLTSAVIGNSVTSIGESAFIYCYGLTSIEIPNSVTSIGKSAFYYCYGLTSIEIPNSVTSIGKSAFYKCSGLTSIEIPNSVTSIGEYAFDGCSGLTSIEIPNSVTSIGDYAFIGCSSLISIEIPNNVTKIGNQTFRDCSCLTSIEIPNSVTIIGESAFRDCSGLTSITIPNSVTSIGSDAFRGCTGLKNIINCSNLIFTSRSQDYGFIAYYADKVVNAHDGAIIDDLLFSTVDGKHTLVEYLGNATNITLPKNYKGEYYVIGENAFQNCSKLIGIVISDSVTNIGKEAFSGCSNLISIVIGNSVTSIGDDAFSNCSKLANIEIPNSVTSIGEYVFSGCSNLASVVIGNGVTSIGEYAFDGCSGLISIEIPNSVTSIGNYAFRRCSGLTSIEIPNSVTSIGESVFYYCSGLTSIEIPNSVTSIGKSAFYYCSGLTSIEIPNSVTSIGEYAFDGCSGLTSIEIPNNVTSIGRAAFSSCSGLTSIEIPSSVTSIGGHAFSDCSGLTSITIPNSVTSIGIYAFEDCSSLTSAVIGNSVTSIGDYAFRGCSSLTSAVIGNSVVRIGSDAFEACTHLNTVINLSNLTLSKGSNGYGFVTYYADKVINAPNGSIIGDFIFSTVDSNHTLVEYLGNAIEIFLPDNCKGEDYAIGAYAFSGCTGLTSIVFGNSVTSIGAYAFSGCTGLTSIVFGNSVTSIGAYAFSGCNGLTSLEFPNSVTVISQCAFSDCHSLTSIEIPASIQRIGIGAFYQNHKLSSVCVHMQNPVDMASNAFLGIADDAVLYVPFTKLNEYQSNDIWVNSFSKIVESSPYVGDTFTAKVDYNKSVAEVDVKVINIEPLEVEVCALKSVIGNIPFEIPSTIKHQRIKFYVTGIGESAFEKSGIKEISLPDGVRYINDSAFRECVGLERINIPYSVEYIGVAFPGCINLKEIVIENRNPLNIVCSEGMVETPESISLYIPGGTYERYASHDFWCRIGKIIENQPVWLGEIVSLPNSSVYLPVYLKSSEDIAGMQFRLILPEGVSVFSDVHGLKDATFTTERTEGVTIIGNKEPGTKNSYLFVALSLDGNPFKGSDGAVMNIELYTDGIPFGTYATCINDVYLSTSDFETNFLVSSLSEINVVKNLPGDSNNDGRISVVDVSMIINDILRKNNVDFCAESADMNKDGRISIVDATMVTNLILEK